MILMFLLGAQLCRTSSAIIVGSEGRGNERLGQVGDSDQLLSIPMSGDVASPNVSVACGLCLARCFD